MQKSESSLIVWLKQPSTWWKIWGVALVILSAYYSLNYRVSSLEEFRQEVNVIEIKTTLAEIQRDIQRIKNDLQAKN